MKISYVPQLPKAPENYDQKHMTDFTRAIMEYMRLQNSGGPLVASDMTFTRLPDSDVGLKKGQLYAEADGIVRIVL